MSAILGSYRLAQKRRAEMLKTKKKQQETKRSLQAKLAQSQAEASANFQYSDSNGGAQPTGAPLWEDPVYDDSPFSHEVIFDSEFSEWKFMYGPSEGQESLYVVRLYRRETILYVNGEKLESKDYTLEEQKSRGVIKMHFMVGKFKCQIISSFIEKPNDQNQTLIFNGNRIQFEEDAFEAE
ncbi:uncharacterized protein LOC110459764 [Mizuhopecten yessoensis]|uniref:Uncharacterized protein n=1 Tax=Mizuhopecten yessoensis TaxID=6573 RepID=A0A210Q3T2_MIZYE|nr:uncharacterized protein LOC110459764 [Mizuhopecten yessoensis]OWF43418.1 hypothetical protein KP79_PYT24166 [Mizuhopecten yessoensis]